MSVAGSASLTGYEVKVLMHNTSKVETYNMDTSKMSHGGGDSVLALNFIRVMQGREKTVAPIDAGLLSVLMCLKAKALSETNTFRYFVGMKWSYMTICKA